MPYAAGHRDRVRKKIIDSARKLFNRRGFESVSISEIMADAKMTHGGFYSYFGSKSDLYAEVLNCFFTDPEWQNCWEGVHVDLSSSDVGSQVVRAYLSRQHYEDVENSCPMVALPTDVARSGTSARRAFERVFRAMVNVLERSLVDKQKPRKSKAGTATRRMGQKGKAETSLKRLLDLLEIWLGGLDSNQDTQSQSLVSYQLDDLPADGGVTTKTNRSRYPMIGTATIHPY